MSALMKSAFALCVLSIVCQLPVVVAADNADRATQLRDGSLAKLHARASRGEEIRIVTLGGSITQNNSHGHSKLIPDWFAKRYPQCKVTGINAGLSSTCSHSGAFRLADHVLAHSPVDLLVVEFAVNDDQDARHSYEHAVRGMEGIVRHAYRENVPVLMVLYVNEHLLDSVQKGEPGIPLRAHRAVALHYGVPTVDVAKALADASATGGMTWKEYGGCHPSTAGYLFAVERMTDVISQMLENDTPRDRTKLPASLDEASYSNADWVPPSEATFEGEWKHGHPSRELLPVGSIRKDYLEYPLARSQTPGAKMRFAFEGTAVSAFVLAGPDAGIVSVRIDGGEPREIDLYHGYSRGLNYPRTSILADGLAPGRHEMELTVSKNRNAASKGNAVNLLYLGVNRSEE